MTCEDQITRLSHLVADQPDEVTAAIAAGSLGNWIYSTWYLALPAEARAAEACSKVPFDQLWSALDGVVDRLAPWDDDWAVLSVHRDGSIMAGRGEEQRWLPPGRFAAPDRPGLPVVPGERVSAGPIQSWGDNDTGYWVAQVATLGDAGISRLYVNVGADEVGLVASALLERLASAGIAFQMKCPGRPDAYARPDALVLYVRDGDWEGIGPSLVEVLDGMDTLLRPGTPPLTRQLASGVGFAQDPGEGKSFGQHRSDILAARIAQDVKTAANPDALVAALVDAGIDPLQPWMRAS